MNFLLKVSVFVLQSNSCRSIIKADFLNQISYIEQLKLKLLRNQDFSPIISRFITEFSHKKQWHGLALAQRNLATVGDVYLPQILWVAQRDSVGKLIKKRFINDPLFTFSRALVLAKFS